MDLGQASVHSYTWCLGCLVMVLIALLHASSCPPRPPISLEAVSVHLLLVVVHIPILLLFLHMLRASDYLIYVFQICCLTRIPRLADILSA